MLVSAAPLVEAGWNFSFILCSILCIIWYALAAFASLVLVVSGSSYLLTEDHSKREEAKINVIYALVILIILIISPYAATYLTGGIKNFSFGCNCLPNL